MGFLATHELALTWAALAAGLGLIGFNVWRETRPKQSLDVSIWPTTPFLLAGAFLVILAAVHLLTLYGIEKPPR
jgi:acyl-CoA synthetase (NDP forming)